MLSITSTNLNLGIPSFRHSILPTMPVDLSQFDLTDLNNNEMRLKLCRELNTIFRKYGENGLTDIEISCHAKALAYSGYDGFVPDAIVRSAICKWNKMCKPAPRIIRVKVPGSRKGKYFLAEHHKVHRLGHIRKRMAARKILRFVKRTIGEESLHQYLWKPEGPVARQLCNDLADGRADINLRRSARLASKSQKKKFR